MGCCTTCQSSPARRSASADAGAPSTLHPIRATVSPLCRTLFLVLLPYFFSPSCTVFIGCVPVRPCCCFSAVTDTRFLHENIGEPHYGFSLVCFPVLLNFSTISFSLALSLSNRSSRTASQCSRSYICSARFPNLIRFPGLSCHLAALPVSSTCLLISASFSFNYSLFVSVFDCSSSRRWIYPQRYCLFLSESFLYSISISSSSGSFFSKDGGSIKIGPVPFSSQSRLTLNARHTSAITRSVCNRRHGAGAGVFR